MLATLALVRYLVDQGAPLDCKDVLGSSLIFHCIFVLGEAGLRMAKFLLRRGADVNARDRFGIPPLFAYKYPGKCIDWDVIHCCREKYEGPHP